MKFAVISFPGSNCDEDLYYAVNDDLNQNADIVPYTTTDLSNYDAIMLPGGFSYGDYLRGGAIAKLAPVMSEVRRFAKEDRPIIGICNGFQILCEANLLPGSLRNNKNMEFISEMEQIKVENNQTMFSNQCDNGQTLTIPIAHGEGNYYCDEKTLNELKENRQIIFTYKNNPNGSVADIAGISNKKGNILGMMPHPERASENILGSTDGLNILNSIVNNAKEVDIDHVKN